MSYGNFSSEQEDNTPMSDAIAKGQRSALQELYRGYCLNVDFKVGEIIEWKSGLKNRRYPTYGQPAIVVEVIEDPLINTCDDSGSPYFQEPLDILIGFIINNEFLFYHADKKRFKKVKG